MKKSILAAAVISTFSPFMALPAVALESTKSLGKIAFDKLTGYMLLSGFMLADSEAALKPIFEKLDGIENAMKAQSDKAAEEIKNLGKVSTDTQTAIDNLGTKQRELADEILQIKQRITSPTTEEKNDTSLGGTLIKADTFADFAAGNLQKMRCEVKNTVIGSDVTVAPDRRAGVVGGAFQPLTIEDILLSAPTTSNAIEYTRENVFTNSAAEAAENTAKGESSLTFTLVNQPVSTVAHFIRASKQLVADAPALAAYINARMGYGLDQKVESQLVVGDGLNSNISGMYKAGNFTPHGYTNAALTAISATLKKLVLIRKMIADCWAAGFPADAIILNPSDWATIEIELFTTAAGQQLYSISEGGTPRLFNIPVVQTVGIAADNVMVGSVKQGYMKYDRQSTIIELSESDADNFTKNLVTIRAERRLALATERPSAMRGGDLTPA